MREKGAFGLVAGMKKKSKEVKWRGGLQQRWGNKYKNGTFKKKKLKWHNKINQKGAQKNCAPIGTKDQELWSDI